MQARIMKRLWRSFLLWYLAVSFCWLLLKFLTARSNFKARDFPCNSRGLDRRGAQSGPLSGSFYEGMTDNRADNRLAQSGLVTRGLMVNRAKKKRAPLR